MKKKILYHEGEKVWLKAFEEEPRQTAILLQDVTPGDDLVMVEVNKKYRTNKHDDGLREITPDQIEVKQAKENTMKPMKPWKTALGHWNLHLPACLLTFRKREDAVKFLKLWLRANDIA